MSQADYSSAQACFLFALMNSAPAELLHLLVHAALQPSLAPHFRSQAAAVTKKNAGNHAGIKIAFQKRQIFFRRKRRLARRGRTLRRKQTRLVKSSTVH
jgi:hypothetical protein